jgi:hypothetical protein
VIATGGAIEIDGAIARPGDRVLVEQGFTLCALERAEIVVVVA